MNQPGGLKGMAGVFAPQISQGNRAKLRVGQRRQTRQRFPIAGLPSMQNVSDFT
jgi:hypothetical protein